MTIYSYISHLCQPLGLGSDDDGDPADFNIGKLDCPDSDGKFRLWDEELPEGVLPSKNPTPNGTKMRRAVAMLKDAGVNDILAHTVPPHPTSQLAQIMAPICYSDHTRWREKRKEMWRDVWALALNQGEQQIWECDGSFEDSIRYCMDNSNIVISAPINAICMYLKQLHLGGSNILSAHPILKYVPELYPEYLPTGRSMDIWHPKIVDVLEYFYRQQFGEGRNIKGIWLTLGGGFVWAETTHMGRGSIYEVRTPYSQQCLARTTDIEMNIDGRHYSSIITKRLGKIAYDLVNRLKDLTDQFYFHTYTIESTSYKAGHQAAGWTGVCRELCERMDNIPEIDAHMVCSHAHECSPMSSAEAQSLIRKHPNIDFIAGVGWGKQLHSSGLARLCEGFQSIEVGLQDAMQWSNLKPQIEYLNFMIEKML